MIDLTQLANDSVALLAPLLPLAAQAAGKVADHMTDGFLSEPGAKLFAWLTEQFKGKPPAATLDRAFAEPQNQHRLESLRIEILELAEKDTLFREQLERLVAAGTKERTTATQIANPSGDNNRIAQMAGGRDNKIQIR